METNHFSTLQMISDRVIKEVTKTAQSMRINGPSRSQLYSTIDHIESFTSLTTEAVFCSNCDQNVKIDLKQISIELLQILRAIVSSWEKNDNFMLCDLMEHELVDNLIRWKIQIISTLKNQATPNQKTTTT
ncbi:MAG: hypothetical protein JNM93_10180 [Bacteriovoracaceae bacterium]|nr:hypothetical protein [Bacteriovoracaceae bacterium]